MTKFKDDSANNMINGEVVGIRVGLPMQDALAPDDDGYDHLRLVEHIGTKLQDAAVNAVNPTPVEE